MENTEEIPEYLYRGMCIRYEDLNNFTFSGVDMKLPYEAYIDEQGRETVRDGNEYGIYMSDNPKVVMHSYGNATKVGNGTYINPHVALGIRKEYVKIPDVGICYKIFTKNLNIKKPWIRDEFQRGNNGYDGNEWITDKIPAENYEIMQVNIGKDILHDEQDVELDDVENLSQRVIEIMEQRKSRLEIFAQEMSRFLDKQREQISLIDFQVFKEIYGENGFYYATNFEDIDTTSNVGMIRYLMAKVYHMDRENIDFKALSKLQGIKERAEFAEKKGKPIDIKGLIKDEELINLIEKRENAQMEEQEEIVDYYEKYGISHNEDWTTIRPKLKELSKTWMKRQSTSKNGDILEEINRELDQIDEALRIFDPKNKKLLEDYNNKLKRSNHKKNKAGESLEKSTLKSVQELGMETLEEQKDTVLLDKIEQDQLKQALELEKKGNSRN